MNAKQLVKMADKVSANVKRVGFQADARMCAAVLRVAAGVDVQEALAVLPAPIADAIREARAVKADR